MRASLLLFSACLFACSSSGGDAPSTEIDAGSETDTAPAATVESLCGEYAVAYCRNYATCATPLDKLFTADESECRARSESTCIWRHTLHGRVNAVADLQACVTSLRDAACGSANEVAYKCRFTGALALDARCSVDDQCASGACRSAEACGRCVTSPTAGQPCGSGADCRGDLFSPAELFCDLATNKCASRHAEGASCAADSECRHGLACVGSVCRQPLTIEGATCGESVAACSIDAGLYCDPTASRCTKLRVVSIGESCASLGAECAANAYCEPSTSKCTARAALAAACSGSPNACVVGAICVKGTCVSIDDHCR